MVKQSKPPDLSGCAVYRDGKNIVETERGRYVNFLLPVDLSPNEAPGPCGWNTTRHCWACSATEEAYARWVLEREFNKCPK